MTKIEDIVTTDHKLIKHMLNEALRNINSVHSLLCDVECDELHYEYYNSRDALIRLIEIYESTKL